MARTALPVTAPNKTGVTLGFTASDQVNGNSFVNDGRSVLVARNTGGAPATLTLRVTRIEDGDAVTGLKVPDRVVSIPVSTAAAPATILGTFSQDIYNQPDGTVSVDCSASLMMMVLSSV
jgi:hypothetical protein